ALPCQQSGRRRRNRPGAIGNRDLERIEYRPGSPTDFDGGGQRSGWNLEADYRRRQRSGLAIKRDDRVMCNGEIGAAQLTAELAIWSCKSGLSDCSIRI